MISLFVFVFMAQLSSIKITGSFTGSAGKCSADEVSAIAAQYGLASGDTNLNVQWKSVASALLLPYLRR
jgi:hypothetical protein